MQVSNVVKEYLIFIGWVLVILGGVFLLLYFDIKNDKPEIYKEAQTGCLYVMGIDKGVLYPLLDENKTHICEIKP